MRFVVSIFFIGLFSLGLRGAETDSSVVFNAAFLKHEFQRYSVSRALYTVQKGDTLSLERLRFNVEVFVTDSTSDYYLLSWKFSGFAINTEDRELERVIAGARPVELVCRTSKPGVLMELLGREKVSDCLMEVMPKVLEPYLKLQTAQEKAEVSRIYDLRDALETLMIRSIEQFFQVYGLGYTLGEVVDVPVQRYSHFSRKPLSGITRKKLTRIDLENHVAVLSMATFLDQKELRKSVEEYLRIPALPSSGLEQENMGCVVMDLKTGWVLWSLDQWESQVGSDVYGESIDIQYVGFQ